MKIVIENTTFNYDDGCRLLKLKHENSPFEELNDFWDKIEPLTFKEIVKWENLENRRVGILCLGLERLVKEVNPRLIKRETISKKTNFIDKNGNLIKENYEDVYELYEVKGEIFGKGRWNNVVDDCHFVKFKDTSTDREYMIWVDLRSVFNTNKDDCPILKKENWYSEETIDKLNPIQCIAWTIQTNVQKRNIKEIVRQGDCVFVKPKDNSVPLLNSSRHLTEKEYRTLLKTES